MKITKEYMSQLISQYKMNNTTPFVIEVLGTPNSGKTSAIQTFEKILKRNGLKYKIIYEAATKCKIKDKLSPDFNIWTLNETIKRLIEAYTGNYDIVICERGLLDAICWYELYYQDGLITENEYHTLLNYILMKRFVKRINCCYVMECSVEVSLDRENLADLLEVTGTIINEDILTKYNSALKNVLTSYGQHFEKIVELDTSDLSQVEISRNFVSSMLSCIESLSAGR